MINNYSYEKFRNQREEKKYLNSISLSKVKCKCGHSVVIPNAERTICSWCGEWVYKNHLMEFKYNLKKAINLKKPK